MLACGSLLACFTACGESSDGCDCKKNNSDISEVVVERDYVTSKIRSCDEAATSIKNGCNAGLTDLYAEGVKLSGAGWIEFSDGQFESISSDSRFSDLIGALPDYVREYYNDFDICSGAVYIKDSCCVAAVVRVSDSPKYWGSYPMGHIKERGISEDDAKAAVAEFTE